MAYNLDFSGWKEARKAISDSIINQADIAANLIANKANIRNKTLSSLLGSATSIYGDYKKNKESEDMFNMAIATGLIPETSGDFMQDLENRNAITGDIAVDEKNAKLFKRFLMDKYGF